MNKWADPNGDFTDEELAAALAQEIERIRALGGESEKYIAELERELEGATLDDINEMIKWAEAERAAIQVQIAKSA